MKYNIFINQRAVMETGLNEKLDLVDLALFDFIYDLMNNNRVPKTLINGVEYTQIRHSLVSEQCPILGINHRDPLRKRMLKLVDAGLLVRYERNQEENQSLYARGPRFSTLVFSSWQSGDLPLNNSTLPLNDDTTCRQSTTPPAADKRHDNNTSTNNNIKENTTTYPKKETKKGLDLTFVSSEYIQAFGEWLNYKRSINDMYKTQRGVEGAYRDLLAACNNNPAYAMEVVNYSIDKEYKGIFPPRQNQNNYGNSSNAAPSRAQQLAAELKRQGFSFT